MFLTTRRTIPQTLPGHSGPSCQGMRRMDDWSASSKALRTAACKSDAAKRALLPVLRLDAARLKDPLVPLGYRSGPSPRSVHTANGGRARFGMRLRLDIAGSTSLGGGTILAGVIDHLGASTRSIPPRFAV